MKLLRVLQDHEFERVGSSRTQQADVRVIAATNRDLKEEMRAGRFREDLFYRLNVIPLVVPPLRERREDIPPLVDHVLKSLRKRGLDRVRAVSPEAMRHLMEYPWPGNVRELENVLERGAVCSRGAVLGMEDIADEVREHGRARPKETPSVPAADLLASREDAPCDRRTTPPRGRGTSCFGRSTRTGGTRVRPPQRWGSTAPPSGGR